MKGIKLCLRRIRAGLRQIHLVDRCLMTFMMVLLFQSAFSLFFSRPVLGEIGNVDVIVRTSSAAIFGYFLSANFVRRASEKNRKKQEIGATEEIEAIRLQSVDEKHERQEGSVQEVIRQDAENQMAPATNSLQVVIASVIGLFCLGVLIMLRDVAEFGGTIAESVSMAATVTQFRDFVSGCVGFLIGCPTHSGK